LNIPTPVLKAFFLLLIGVNLTYAAYEMWAAPNDHGHGVVSMLIILTILVGGMVGKRRGQGRL
jgi:predicted tellurium resistance membrane protein TerC